MAIEILKAIVYGIVEGISEWLPVSSTGHMILLSEILKLNVSESFLGFFMVVIQLGAILAVIIASWKKIWPLGIRRAGGGKGGLYIKKEIIRTWILVIISCIPAIIVGLLLDDIIDRYLENWVCVSIMLIVVGLLFIIVENLIRGKSMRVRELAQLTARDALIIGLCQVVAALLPGTSRSGATIIGALLIGVSRTVAVEYTFILAIPVMAGASLLKFLKYDGAIGSTELAIMITGMVTAFIVSMAVIRMVLNYIRTHDFKVFGWYRIILGVLVILFFGIFR